MNDPSHLRCHFEAMKPSALYSVIHAEAFTSPLGDIIDRFTNVDQYVTGRYTQIPDRHLDSGFTPVCCENSRAARRCLRLVKNPVSTVSRHAEIGCRPGRGHSTANHHITVSPSSRTSAGNLFPMLTKQSERGGGNNSFAFRIICAWSGID